MRLNGGLNNTRIRVCLCTARARLTVSAPLSYQHSTAAIMMPYTISPHPARGCVPPWQTKRNGQPGGRPVGRRWGRGTIRLLRSAKTASRLVRVEYEWDGGATDVQCSDGGRDRARSEPGTRPPSSCEFCAATPWPLRTRSGSQASRGSLYFLYHRLAVHRLVECVRRLARHPSEMLFWYGG